MTHTLSTVAWPYANGPCYIGYVASSGAPSSVFSCHMRVASHGVLMVSGTDEYGTPTLVTTDEEGLSARELADRNNQLIVEDLVALGLSYDPFTRITAGSCYHVVQDMFTTVQDNGYIVQQVIHSAISPPTGRTLPDRYIKGICPICGAESVRGDQCDTYGNQLDPTNLISPHSRISGETPEFVETTYWLLNLPALAQTLSVQLDGHETSGIRRPSVIKFFQNLLRDTRPRVMIQDIDWGIPVSDWENQPTKRFYVWFDAAIGYPSAFAEWAHHSGDPEAWRVWWNDPQVLSYYFMGKGSIALHSQIWSAEPLGYSGQGATGDKLGRLGVLDLPTEVVSNGPLVMEGRKFSSSHSIVIYVHGFLERYQAGALRCSTCTADPETAGADFTWAEFVRRTNGEFAAGWGNLVNRTVSMIHKRFGQVPEPAELQDIDRTLLDAVEAGLVSTGNLVAQHRQKTALGEATCLIGEANKYVADTQFFKLKGEDPVTQTHLATVLCTLTQTVTDLNLMLSPFLPHTANDVDRVLGGSGRIAPMPYIEEATEFDPEHLPKAFDDRTDYPIITSDYQDAPTWRRRPVTVDTPMTKSAPVFTRPDKSIIEAELARYTGSVSNDVTGS